MEAFENILSTIDTFVWGPPLIALILLGGIIAIVYGCKVYGWYFAELSAVFVIMGILSAIVMGWGPNKIGELYSKGFTDIAMACMMIGLARGILMVLQAGNIIDTVVYYFSLPLAAFPSWFCGVAMLAMQTLLNFLIPSGSGQAGVAMPIIGPIAQGIGMNLQSATLAFNFGDGFCNYILPTSTALMGIISACNIPYDRWMRFMWKMFAIWLVVGTVLLVIAQLINYGPM